MKEKQKTSSEKIVSNGKSHVEGAGSLGDLDHNQEDTKKPVDPQVVRRGTHLEKSGEMGRKK